jgi:hypothetical protein
MEVPGFCLVSFPSASLFAESVHIVPLISFVRNTQPLFSHVFFDNAAVIVSYQGFDGSAKTGLKIPRPQGCAGSTPAVRTTAD